MIVNTRFFPVPMLDNDINYIASLTGVIESCDEFATMEVVNTPEMVHFRIAPSVPKYSQPILQEILKLNNLYNLRLTLSKSIKMNGTIAFDVTK